MSRRRSGMATAAVASLARSTETFLIRLLRCPAEAPLTPLILRQGLDELSLAEVGPQGVGHVDLGIGELPEQEVRDAHLAAGADEQVRIRHPLGTETRCKAELIDIIGTPSSCLHVTRQPPRGLHNVLASTVTHAQAHRQTGEMLGLTDNPL